MGDLTSLSIARKDGSYDIISGYIINTIWGVTDAFGVPMWPYHLIHLPTGAYLCATDTLDNAFFVAGLLMSMPVDWTKIDINSDFDINTVDGEAINIIKELFSKGHITI